MKKLIFIAFLIASLQANAQEASGHETWLIYLELYGNGGQYSLNAEHFKQGDKFSTGDRFGFAIPLNKKPEGGSWSLLYERNFCFGKKRFRPEVGVGSSLLYYPGSRENAANSNLPFPESSYKKEWDWDLIPRLGVRYLSARKFNARFGLLLPIHLMKIDDDEWAGSKKNLYLGLSLGWSI